MHAQMLVLIKTVAQLRKEMNLLKRALKKNNLLQRVEALEQK